MVRSKKPTLSTPSETTIKDDEKKEKVTDEEKNNKKEPLKFLTWNANSFLLRVKNNWPEFTKFISSLDPDIIAIQEVRMPAAGSKGAPKCPGELKDDTSAARVEKQITVFGGLLLIQSMREQHCLKKSILVPLVMRYFLDFCVYRMGNLFIQSFFFLGSKYEPDGRVILAEFESFRFLNTYIPNNSWKDEESSFRRRRKWDKRMLEFVLQTSDKPLIWCGDLNVSHEDIDVSHPDFFSTAKLNGYVPPNKEDCGQSGGKLIDAYRFLHKDKDMERGFSWCGNPVGKHRGKRMRIDYFLVSETLKDRIVLCEMHGHGIELEGFYGSDHCPVSLELSSPTDISNNNVVSAEG
ncbi:Endonuclease/exonuclease/phosphatase [Dillenia turbinata]|uniref:Endonuclease/exonuclease/phosphatase n=1 Tax=Dillenia turbinata TaxID=194707 RepID=A0AAN8UTZ2_9MAGN